MTARYHLVDDEPDPTWRDRAACRTEDPEMFFPLGNTGPALAQIETAKTVCRTCPVTDDCLAWALNARENDGIWGGHTEYERRTIQRRRQRQRAGARAAA